MPWKGKRVLISGGTGFIGKNLSLRLQSEGAEPIVFGRRMCDLSDWPQAREYLSDLKGIDYIFHLATYQRTGNIQYRIKADQFNINTAIHVNLLRAWREFLPEAKLVSVGCSCSYPEKDRPLAEDDYWAGSLHESVESYGYAKKLLQVGQKAYAQQYGFHSLYAILSTVYGPHDNFDAEKSHFIAALMQRICEAKTNGAPQVEIWGDGTQVRECLYIDDQIDSLLIAAEQSQEDLINIGGNQACTVREVAEAISDCVGYEGRLFYNKERFTGTVFKVLDSSRFRELTGWAPRETLRTGLRKTLEWFKTALCPS
jgi:GDP-L-fucose synthase